jgi:hypothetical protein
MGGACSMSGGEEECIGIGYRWESQKEIDHWKDQDVSGQY